jgi:hypothetical protein
MAWKQRNGLVLHMGAAEATLEEVRAVPTPDATESWSPIPHALLYETVTKELTSTGLEIEDEAFGLYGQHGERFFATVALTAPKDAEYRTIVGLRNSHDKSNPAGLVAGTTVFVCDNNAFYGEVSMARKHTVNILRDLPGLTNRAVAKLNNLRGFQDHRVDRYKEWEVDDAMVNTFLIRLIDNDVLPVTKLKDLLAEWRTPSHAEFKPRTAWSLFNCITEVLKGGYTMLPKRTITLHGMMDTVVGVEAPATEQDADYAIEVAA